MIVGVKFFMEIYNLHVTDPESRADLIASNRKPNCNSYFFMQFYIKFGFGRFFGGVLQIDFIHIEYGNVSAVHDALKTKQPHLTVLSKI